MLKTSLICFLSICLLQIAHTVPLPADNADKADSSSSEELEPRQELQVMVVVQLLILTKESVEAGNVFFKDAIKELNALPDKSEALLANITRLSDFVKESTDLDHTVDDNTFTNMFGSMFKLAEIECDYKAMPEGDPLTETLKTAFEKSGWKKFEKELEKRLAAFVEDFEESFTLYLRTLSEKDKDPKMIAWFDNFKAEKDNAKKMETFGEFFDFFN